MTKLITIDPRQQRQRSTLVLPEIPVNSYVSDPALEAAKYGAANLMRIYRDMAIIREFETMLDRIKKEGVYQGIVPNLPGSSELPGRCNPGSYSLTAS